jgi:hypothetical protein
MLLRASFKTLIRTIVTYLILLDLLLPPLLEPANAYLPWLSAWALSQRKIYLKPPCILIQLTRDWEKAF